MESTNEYAEALDQADVPIQIDLLKKVFDFVPVGIYIIRLEDFEDLGSFHFSMPMQVPIK